VSRHVVIGTAGHVDHGKTALVRALTGVETDRWEEEKRRGITIDLGFAPLELTDGITASIVDVPGHEDFVRNMVAGAAGVDVALLVVAADEGVMPQTVEHLAILEFLGVRTGLPVVTKADLVERDWLDLVVSDLGDRLTSSRIAWEAPLIASAVTGEGIDMLTASLAAAAHRAADRSSDDLFRLPVDRVFSVAGAGTVVTGTAWSGSVNVGDEVRTLPGEQRGRVRSIEVHGQQRDRAEPGRRTALAIAGVDRAAIARGSVVVTDASWQESRAVDVLLTLLPHARALTQRSRVRFHLGTAEVMARLTPVAGEIGPGATAPARLRLENPVVARWGDRGVIRSYSPVTTIGGCMIADPWPRSRPRRPVRLEDRASAQDAARAGALVRLAGRDGVSLSDLPVRLGIRPRAVEETATEVVLGGAVRIGETLVEPEVVESLRRAILQALTGYHQEHPLEPGMPRGLLRVAAGSTGFADHVLEGLASERQILLEGSTARLSDFRAALSRHETALGERIRDELVAAGWEGRTPAELAELGDPERAHDLLEFFVRQGTAVRVGRDRYYDRCALDRLRDTVVAEVRRLGRATPAQLREKTGLTRKYLIPVLEWLDACGFTVREGDARPSHSYALIPARSTDLRNILVRSLP
jgi:selenocysteine-specific elongation factor